MTSRVAKALRLLDEHERATRRHEERARELLQRQQEAEKRNREYQAECKIKEQNVKKGCEHALGLAPGSVRGFDCTVDGGGHFTGITVLYTGGSQWICTGRNTRDRFAHWRKLGEELSKKKEK